MKLVSCISFVDMRAVKEIQDTTSGTNYYFRPKAFIKFQKNDNMPFFEYLPPFPIHLHSLGLGVLIIIFFISGKFDGKFNLEDMKFGICKLRMSVYKFFFRDLIDSRWWDVWRPHSFVAIR